MFLFFYFSFVFLFFLFLMFFFDSFVFLGSVDLFSSFFDLLMFLMFLFVFFYFIHFFVFCCSLHSGRSKVTIREAPKIKSCLAPKTLGRRTHLQQWRRHSC